MEENRKISCSSSILKANNCSGNHNTDKILDIEDIHHLIENLNTQLL